MWLLEVLEWGNFMRTIYRKLLILFVVAVTYVITCDHAFCMNDDESDLSNRKFGSINSLEEFEKKSHESVLKSNNNLLYGFIALNVIGGLTYWGLKIWGVSYIDSIASIASGIKLETLIDLKDVTTLFNTTSEQLINTTNLFNLGFNSLGWCQESITGGLRAVIEKMNITGI